MNNKRRQRLPRIKPSIKQLIVSEAIRYPEKPRLVLATNLKDTIERTGEVSPTEETLIKMISNARNQEVSSLDTPWHLGLMRKLEPEYRISPEAIPYIFQVKEWCEKTKKETPITIRQAFWIAQFCHIYSPKMKDKDIEALWKWSWVYANYEIICKLAGTDFETTELDVSFWFGGTAGPLVASINRDVQNNTRYVMRASDLLSKKEGEK